MDNPEKNQPIENKQPNKQSSIIGKIFQGFYGFSFVIITLIGLLYLLIMGANAPNGNTQPLYWYLIPVWILFILGVAKLGSYIIKKTKSK